MSSNLLNWEHVGLGCYTAPGFTRPIVAKRQDLLKNHRLYLHEEGDTKIYRRGATFLAEKIKELKGDNLFLNSWRDDLVGKFSKGKSDFDFYLNSLADFGTLGHIFLDLFVKERLTTDLIEDEVNKFAIQKGLSDIARFKATETALKNALCVNSFFAERDIIPISIEQMVTSSKIDISTPIDLFGTFVFNRKKCYLLGNYKTSENNQDHKWQCAIEHYCFMESIYPLLEEKLPVIVGTFRPVTNFKKNPSCEFENYTEFACQNDTIESIENISREVNKKFIPNITLPSWEGILNKDSIFSLNNIF